MRYEEHTKKKSKMKHELKDHITINQLYTINYKKEIILYISYTNNFIWFYTSFNKIRVPIINININIRIVYNEI